MGKDSYYQQEYKCPECGVIQKHYIWNSKAETAKHECIHIECDQVLTISNEHYEEINEAFRIGSKMTPAQVRKDRKARSHNDFVKNVLPEIPKSEQEHFRRKGIVQK